MWPRRSRHQRHQPVEGWADGGNLSSILIITLTQARQKWKSSSIMGCTDVDQDLIEPAVQHVPQKQSACWKNLSWGYKFPSCVGPENRPGRMHELTIELESWNHPVPCLDAWEIGPRQQHAIPNHSHPPVSSVRLILQTFKPTRLPSAILKANFLSVIWTLPWRLCRGHSGGAVGVGSSMAYQGAERSKYCAPCLWLPESLSIWRCLVLNHQAAAAPEWPAAPRIGYGSTQGCGWRRGHWVWELRAYRTRTGQRRSSVAAHVHTEWDVTCWWACSNGSRRMNSWKRLWQIQTGCVIRRLQPEDEENILVFPGCTWYYGDDLAITGLDKNRSGYYCSIMLIQSKSGGIFNDYRMKVWIMPWMFCPDSSKFLTLLRSIVATFVLFSTIQHPTDSDGGRLR